MWKEKIISKLGSEPQRSPVLRSITEAQILTMKQTFLSLIRNTGDLRFISRLRHKFLSQLVQSGRGISVILLKVVGDG